MGCMRITRTSHQSRAKVDEIEMTQQKLLRGLEGIRMIEHYRKTCVLLAVALSIGCLPANGKQPRATYPTQLHGVWQDAGNKCVLPGNVGTDSGFEIKPDKLVGHGH